MKLVYSLLLSIVFSVVSNATVYEVGPGKPLNKIAAVPWSTLNPGDTVLIYYKSTPYNEKWSIGRAGTPTAPITVRGVPNSAGVRPIIDGNHAITPAGLYSTNQERGLLRIGATRQTSGIQPEYIVIEGLEFRNATTGNNFTNSDGGTQKYSSNAAGIYVTTGSHITIRNCLLSSNSNGLFISGGAGLPNSDFLIESNAFKNNGNTGSQTEHHSYTQAAGITFQYNVYRALRSGSNGSALKDRSAGTVIRYNWIEDGNRQLDLVDATLPSIFSDPRYRETFVYGNTLIEVVNTNNNQIVSYGGDSGNTLNYRKGTLYFYNNTVVSQRTGDTAIFRLSTLDESCDARNNIFHVTAAGANVVVAVQTGSITLHRNWMKTGWKKFYQGFPGSVVDDGSTIVGASPGFYNEALRDYTLTAASPNVNAATLQSPLVSPTNDVVMQYKMHRVGVPRVTGGTLDVGAYEKH